MKAGERWRLVERSRGRSEVEGEVTSALELGDSGRAWGVLRWRIADGDERARLVLEAPAMLEALRAILGGQLGGQVDTCAERFENARAILARIDGAEVPR